MQIKEIGECRACHGSSFHQLLDLGNQAIIKFKNSSDEADDFSPLSLFICTNCKLVQLRHSVEQDRMFRDYHYVSGMNASMRTSLLDVVKHAEQLVDLQPDDVVMDIGSNDGTLLRCYRTFVKKVGFEPALNIPAARDIYTAREYFKFDPTFVETHGKAKIVTAIAMFYDLEDPNIFCADVKKILHEEGVFIIQMNYLGSMVENLTLDNISHEHLCYYSVNVLDKILERNGLFINHISFNDVNGGSVRVVASHDKMNKISSVLWPEQTDTLSDLSTYVEFARRIKGLRASVRLYVLDQKAAGKNIWGYGASTRGNTLLQWLGFDSTIIDKIADRNPLKHGKFTAGGNIPICSEEEMRAEKPDNLLILPYHFRKEFLEREKEYLENGGKMIFPLPKFQVVSKWHV